MAKPTLLRPQFFHTLLPGFHTHLMIPEHFFSKYIEEGRSVEKTTAELKYDASDLTWRVEMTGRRLGDGWEEFAVANDLRFGCVVLVRYEGDMVFRVSNLGQNCCEIQDLSPPCSNIDKSLLKKRLYPRTQVDRCHDDDYDEDDIELPRKKKVKMKSSEAEAVSSSDNSSFVALVTASSLRTDKLYLPQHVTSSNGLTRKCRKIVLVDGGERSWTLDLSFNNSSDTFYMSRGWRNFCEENGQEAGGFFMFKLVGNRETPILSFCPTESDNASWDCSQASERESLSTELSSKDEYIQGESSEEGCSSMDSLMETGKKNCSRKRRVSSYSSYLPYYKQYVTFTIQPDVVTHRALSLPALFVRENGINKPGEVYLLGKDGTKWLTRLLVNIRGSMSLGKGWKEFVKANGVESGFTLKLMWEDTTPVFSLCCADSTNDREQEEYFKAIKKQSLFIDISNIDNSRKDENSKEENMSWERKKRGRDSTPSSLKQFVTLTITPSSVRQCRLRLSQSFTRENDINKPGMVILLGKDGIKHQTRLVFEKVKKRMALVGGWKEFAKANGLKMGDSFTLELIWEDTTPVLSLRLVECSIDRGGGGGECSETNQKNYLPVERSSCGKPIKYDNDKEKNNREDDSKEEARSVKGKKNRVRGRDSTSSSQKQFVTLKITPSCFVTCRLDLPAKFVRENSMNKLTMMNLLGRDGRKWPTKIQQDKKGTVSLGKGWKDFAEANNFKSGDSFTMELIWEDTTPVLSLCPAECSIDRGGGCSETNQKNYLPVERNSCGKPVKIDNNKEKNNREDDSKEETRSMEREKNHVRGRDSTSSSQKQFVTLTITPSCYITCRLFLPAQFARENSMSKLRMMNLLGRDGRKWLTKIELDKKGRVSFGKGWKDFAEANNFKSGDSFSMELIWEDGTCMLRLLGTESSSSKAYVSTEPEPGSRDSSSGMEHRSVTLRLTPEDVRACKLHLPVEFIKANGIKRLGRITLLGENKMEWSAYLLTRDGTVALGNGWDEFCVANGVSLGESFTLEFSNEQNKTTPVLEFCSLEANEKVRQC